MNPIPDNCRNWYLVVECFPVKMNKSLEELDIVSTPGGQGMDLSKGSNIVSCTRRSNIGFLYDVI